MRVGILGGSFDPPTYSHLVMGEVASRLVERVVYVPVWHSPLKGEHNVSAEDRFKMMKLGIRGNRKFEVSRVEIERGGESHAVDTLRGFQSIFVEPVLIVGSDCWRMMHRWYEFEEILARFEIVVISRPGHSCRNRALRGLPKRGVTFLAGAGSGLSSTVVRERLRRGLSCRYMVPDRVLGYIESRGLYGAGTNGDGCKGLAGGAISHQGLLPRLSGWLCSPRRLIISPSRTS